MNQTQRAITRRMISDMRRCHSLVDWPLRYESQYRTYFLIERHTGLDPKMSHEEVIKSMKDKSVFIDITLSRDDKTKIKVLSEGGDWLLDQLTEAVENGYRVSVAPDQRNNCYMATIAGVTSKVNNKMVVTSRSKSTLLALTATMYKVAVKKEWGEWADGDIDEDDWLE